jgi:hypothetical protein
MAGRSGTTAGFHKTLWRIFKLQPERGAVARGSLANQDA